MQQNVCRLYPQKLFLSFLSHQAWIIGKRKTLNTFNGILFTYRHMWQVWNIYPHTGDFYYSITYLFTVTNSRLLCFQDSYSAFVTNLVSAAALTLPGWYFLYYLIFWVWSQWSQFVLKILLFNRYWLHPQRSVQVRMNITKTCS